ncbi:ATP-dependent DNA helicase Q-like 5-like protein [Drosera capensis]
MEYDSDSDSGGSHISATPPRSTRAPSLPSPPPPPPPSVPFLLSKAKSKLRIEAELPPKRTLKQNPKPKLAKKNLSTEFTAEERNKRNPSLDSSFLSSDLGCLSSFPVRIRRSVNRESEDSIPFLAAGSRCLSKSVSFGRIGRSCPNFEFSEQDSSLTSGSVPKHGIEEKTSVLSGRNDVCSESGGLGKRVSKPSNLIGNGVDSLPVKRPRCANEGNFVKLNINGHGRKFSFKNRRGNGSGYRGRRSWKRKPRTGGKAGKNGDFDEDGVLLENSRDRDTRESTKSKISDDLIEEAVLEVRKEASDENLMKLLKLTHGYESFRDGQLEAIKMVLAGKSTMLVLPTGAGKSLCYQLPAIVLPGITLVVSPLVALMIDQLKQLPLAIHGATLCSSQSYEEVSETLQMLQEGAIKVLFISPERFLDENFISVVSSTTEVSLVVIDEAHCISEWSHNFRPSYMRLRATILHEMLNAKCIMAMTATATRKILTSVMDALEIQRTNLVEESKLRTNLQLSVETESISKYLSDGNIPAKSYHGGMMAKDRSRVQALFCSNKIRMVVATVAFGMGLDKSDVGAVIHYSLPDSLEEYVQEIGRAGRDGRPSYCHLLFDDMSYLRLRSLMHSDGVDEYAVSRLLGQVFSGGTTSMGKIHALVKESASRKFDIKEEVILTILTQLELGTVHYLHLLPVFNTSPSGLAGKDSMVAAILIKSETKQAPCVFDIPSVANITGLSLKDILNHLQNLKSAGEVTYELKDPAYCYMIKEAPEDLCSLSAQITKWLSDVESSKLRRLDTMFNAAISAAKTCKNTGCHGAQHTACLRKKITSYFSEESDNDSPIHTSQSSPFLRADIKGNSHAKFTPRAIARIMHGIGSPAYPSATWSKSHFWGRYTQMDFKEVMEAAKAELMYLVAKDAVCRFPASAAANHLMGSLRNLPSSLMGSTEESSISIAPYCQS